jgi:hypothetical protein
MVRRGSGVRVPASALRKPLETAVFLLDGNAVVTDHGCSLGRSRVVLYQAELASALEDFAYALATDPE